MQKVQSTAALRRDKTCGPRPHSCHVNTRQFAYLKPIVRLRHSTLRCHNHLKQKCRPRRFYEEREISLLSRSQVQNDHRAISCCRKERISRNEDNDTMDLRRGKLSDALWMTMKAEFCRIWVPLPFPIWYNTKDEVIATFAFDDA